MMASVLSWRLWRAIFHNNLQRFPTHIIYPTATPHKDSPQRPTATIRDYLWRALIILTTIGFFVILPSAMPITAAVAFALFILFAGTLSGWLIAMRITRVIFQQQAKARYDLLILTPPGVLGVHWVIVSRFMRNDQLLLWLRWLPSGFFLIITFMLGGMAIVIALLLPLSVLLGETPFNVSVLLQLSSMLMGIMILYSDYVQSVLIGVLVGILLPTYVQREQATAGFAIASAAFLAIQSLFYLLYSAGMVLLWGWVARAFFTENYALIFAVLCAYLGVMVALREAVIRVMWRVAEDRLWFDATESGIKR